MNRILLILFFIPSLAFGQTEIWRKFPANHDETPQWGANRTNHIQGFLGFGLYTPIAVTSIDYIFGKSWDISLGFLYKYRISNFLNVGSSFSLIYQKVSLNNDGMVKAWDNQIHGKAKLSNYLISTKPLIRFNLSPKRGDYLGTYIDVGCFGSLNFLPTTSFTDEQNGQEYIQKYKRDKLQRQLQYGGMAAIGRDWFRLESCYYVSDWIKEDGFNLPRLSISVMLGF